MKRWNNKVNNVLCQILLTKTNIFGKFVVQIISQLYVNKDDEEKSKRYRFCYRELVIGENKRSKVCRIWSWSCVVEGFALDYDVKRTLQRSIVLAVRNEGHIFYDKLRWYHEFIRP